MHDGRLLPPDFLPDRLADDPADVLTRGDTPLSFGAALAAAVTGDVSIGGVASPITGLGLRRRRAAEGCSDD